MFSLKQVLVISVSVMLLSAAATAFAVKFWFFPKPFKPVVLNKEETQQLERKLDRLESATDAPPHVRQNINPAVPLTPESYSEEGARREIVFSEREINSLLATNTDLAEKLAIDFAEDLVSLRLLLPLEPDFPILGGKTLRLRAGAELAYRDGRPVVILKGISLMGIPLPNAWLGGLKNIDLMREFGGQPGFWQSLGKGLESLQVREGELHLKLRE
jgi:hypothetical protein